jgi:hypothetical protein
LAGLALMSAGNTPTTGPQADNVARAVEFVLSCSTDAGLISSTSESGHSMYGHGFAMLFLAHAYGMEADPLRQKRLAQVLERAVRLTAASQSRDGGWFYTPESQNDEGSVTVTQIQGLRACRDAGVPVSPRTIQRACEYIFKCANSDGGISYALRSRGNSLPAITAAAVSTMYNGGVFEHPVAHGALAFCKKRIAASGGDATKAFQGHVYYSMLYLGQAMWFSGDDDWKGFFPQVRDFLIKQQQADGSWNGDSVGTTYGTSIALMTFLLPYRNLPILQR